MMDYEKIHVTVSREEFNNPIQELVNNVKHRIKVIRRAEDILKNSSERTGGEVDDEREESR